MVFVARLTVDGTFHKGLLRNIQLSQTVDYDMHMDIAAAVVTVHVGADQRLMPRKVGFYIFHADQSQGMEALQMLIGGFVIFMIPQVVGGVVVLLELAAVMLR